MVGTLAMLRVLPVKILIAVRDLITFIFALSFMGNPLAANNVNERSVLGLRTFSTWQYF